MAQISAKRIADSFLIRQASLSRRAGAQEFSGYAKGTSADAAFRKLRDDAKFDRGHGGYSGSIAEKSSFKIRRSDPMTRAEADDFISGDIDSNDKWGPAYAVPICEEKVLGDKEVTVTVPGLNRLAAEKAALAKVQEKMPIKPGVSVALSAMSAIAAKETGPVKIKKTKASDVSTFQVTTTVLGFGVKVFKTLASAEAFMTTSMESLFKGHWNNDDPMGAVWTISEVAPMATYRAVAEPKAGSWTVVVRARTIQKGPIEGWMFYGFASS